MTQGGLPWPPASSPSSLSCLALMIPQLAWSASSVCAACAVIRALQSEGNCEIVCSAEKMLSAVSVAVQYFLTLHTTDGAKLSGHSGGLACEEDRPAC